MNVVARPIKKRFLFETILAVALASLSLTAWNFLEPGKVSIVKWRAVVDVSDDRQLAGIAHDVFFGQVIEKLGQTGTFSEPETHFRVKVFEVLKGSVAGEVTVKQVGGWTWDIKRLRLEHDLQLLEPGKSYLFLTRTSLPRQPEGRHTLVAGYGDIEIQAPKFASEDEVLGSQHADELRQRFTDAVEREIPYGR